MRNLAESVPGLKEVRASRAGQQSTQPTDIRLADSTPWPRAYLACETDTAGAARSPKLAQVLDDPEAMEAQVEQATKLFQAMGDPDAMRSVLQDTLGEEGAEALDALASDPSKLQEAMQQV